MKANGNGNGSILEPQEKHQKVEKEAPKFQLKSKIGTYKLTDKRKLVAVESEFNDLPRLDIREYVDGSKDPAEENWIPTRKGINIPIELCDEGFIKFLGKIVKYLEAQI